MTFGPIHFAGKLWQVREFKTFNAYGQLISAQLDLNYIPPKETAMTDDLWTGRKYRGKLTGHTYTVLSEPFEFEGSWHVVWHEKSHNNGQPLAGDADFENREIYTRIFEPKFAKGDVVTNYSGDRMTIDAVASALDFEGDRMYLVIDAAGKGLVSYESLLSKVSQ